MKIIKVTKTSLFVFIYLKFFSLKLNFLKMQDKENGGDEVVITKMSNKEIVFVGSKLVAKKQSRFTIIHY